jgi:hypothetical protein
MLKKPAQSRISHTSCNFLQSFQLVLLASLFLILLAPPQFALAQNSGLSPTDSDSSATQCHVRVVANDVVVTDPERREVAFQVQPAGIIPEPGEWPYFAWSDTPVGVARALDGSSYLFFGSDGGCHKDCSSKTPRSGSITVSSGTLDHPLGEPLDDPNPPPYEFLLPTSYNLPDYIDYVGGGPVYRVPDGEPGAGTLLLIYHAERPANPFWSWLGLAKSTDEGKTWHDLGLIISGTHPYNPNGALDIGDGTPLVFTDPVTKKKFFYVYFGTETTYLSVARAPYEELLTAAYMDLKTLRDLFHKYYNSQWDQPGMGGNASELFPDVTGETDGDPEMYWSDYRQRIVAIMDNRQYIAYGESVDGLTWPPMQPILGKNPQTAIYGNAIATGLGPDPNILGDTFYTYYTDWPKGVSWQPATMNRLTVTTAATVSGIVPTSATAGGAAFTLTVNGDHFVKTSTVEWSGAPQPTTFVSSTQLTATIPAANIANAGDANVEVLNPRPCGGTSNGESFVISSSSSN